MPDSLRKDSKEVKELFKKNIKCTQVRSKEGYTPREVSAEDVKFDLGVKVTTIVRVTEGEEYWVHSYNRKVYVVEVVN